METRININYTPSGTSEVFGTFTISFQGFDGQIRSVDTKFDPKQLWEFSRDTTSVAFDFLVLAMIVYNVDRAVRRLLYSDDGWKRDLVLLDVGAPDKPCGEAVQMLTQNCCQTIHKEWYVFDSFHLCTEAFDL